MDLANFDWFCYFGMDSLGRKVAYVKKIDSYVINILSELEETRDCLVHFACSNEHFVKPVVFSKEISEENRLS